MNKGTRAIIDEMYTAFKSRDLDTLRTIMHPEIVWKQMDSFPNGGRWIGPDQIFEKVFGVFEEKWTGFQTRIDRVVCDDSNAVVLGVYLGTYNATGQSVDAPFAHAYTIEHEKVTSFTQYTDTYAFVAALDATITQS